MRLKTEIVNSNQSNLTNDGFLQGCHENIIMAQFSENIDQSDIIHIYHIPLYVKKHYVYVCINHVCRIWTNHYIAYTV